MNFVRSLLLSIPRKIRRLKNAASSKRLIHHQTAATGSKQQPSARAARAATPTATAGVGRGAGEAGAPTSRSQSHSHQHTHTQSQSPPGDSPRWHSVGHVILSMASVGVATAMQLINSEVTEFDVEENIAHLMALARIALERGDTDRAEAILNMGIKISDDYKVFIALPYMYDVLATIALAKGETAKAEDLLVSIIEKMVRMGVDERDNQVVDFKLRLARIYSAHRENDFAEIGFRNCLNIQTEKISNGDRSTRTGIVYINCLFWYGLHRLKMGDYVEAKQLIHNAYDYSVKIKGLSPYQEMVILYTMADLNMELEDYDMALQNVQNAIILAKGIGSVDLSRCYAKLARIYLKMKAYDKAKMSALEGSKLAKLFSDRELLEEVDELIEQIDRMEKQ